MHLLKGNVPWYILCRLLAGRQKAHWPRKRHTGWASHSCHILGSHRRLWQSQQCAAAQLVLHTKQAECEVLQDIRPRGIDEMACP